MKMKRFSEDQIHEYDILKNFFCQEKFKDKVLIIWPQECNCEVHTHFKELGWWQEVAEDEQYFSVYSVFEVSLDQAREFLTRAHDAKWGIGGNCFAWVDNQLSWGRD